MQHTRSIVDSIRGPLTWDERWSAQDQGLIACWERGREKRLEDPLLAQKASRGELLVLPWKGGVERIIKRKKHGSLFYLAMWQGLRGEDLDIDPAKELVLTCHATGMPVTFTADASKYAEDQ